MILWWYGYMVVWQMIFHYLILINCRCKNEWNIINPYKIVKWYYGVAYGRSIYIYINIFNISLFSSGVAGGWQWEGHLMASPVHRWGGQSGRERTPLQICRGRRLAEGFCGKPGKIKVSMRKISRNGGFAIITRNFICHYNLKLYYVFLCFSGLLHAQKMIHRHFFV